MAQSCEIVADGDVTFPGSGGAQVAGGSPTADTDGGAIQGLTPVPFEDAETPLTELSAFAGACAGLGSVYAHGPNGRAFELIVMVTVTRMLIHRVFLE